MIAMRQQEIQTVHNFKTDKEVDHYCSLVISLNVHNIRINEFHTAVQEKQTKILEV